MLQFCNLNTSYITSIAAYVNLFLQAVCCSDGKHCCPRGYTCNTILGLCVHGAVKTPWHRTRQVRPTKPAQASDMAIQQLPDDLDTELQRSRSDIDVEMKGSRPDGKVKDVKCDDGTECAGLSSCCSNGKGGYNCCPMPKVMLIVLRSLISNYHMLLIFIKI